MHRHPPRFPQTQPNTDASTGSSSAPAASPLTSYQPLPPLHAAIQSGKPSSIRRVLATMPDAMQMCDRDGDPPLHFALRSGAPIPILECLLAQGARLEGRNMRGETAMHIAFAQPDADPQLLSLLLRHADRNGDGGAWLAAFVPDANGRHAYEGGLGPQRQPRRGMEPVLATLRRHDGWFQAYLANMATAVIHKDCARLATLLAGEMPLDLAIQGGKTALMMAAELGHQSIVDMLLAHAEEHGMRQLNLTAAHSGDTALMLAAFHGHVRVVERLLSASADTEVPGRCGDTALMAAAVAGHEGIAERLLTAGAIVDARNALGRTALMFAAVAGHPATVEVLLRHGAEVNARDAEGRTALAFAALHARRVDSGRSIQQRIEAMRVDPAVNIAYTVGIPPSTDERRQGKRGGGSRYRDTSQMLLHHGAEVDACDARGATPLMLAAGNGHIEILAVLLGAGADCKCRDDRGRAAFAYATAGGHSHAARVLQACPH